MSSLRVAESQRRAVRACKPTGGPAAPPKKRRVVDSGWIRLIKPSNIDSRAQRILGIALQDQVAKLVAVRSNTRSTMPQRLEGQVVGGARPANGQAVSTTAIGQLRAEQRQSPSRS